MTTQKVPAKQPTPIPSMLTKNPAFDAWSYWLDAWQRGVLFLDVMRQRSSQYEEHAAKIAPNVLKFGAELVMDGRTLPRHGDGDDRGTGLAAETAAIASMRQGG